MAWFNTGWFLGGLLAVLALGALAYANHSGWGLAGVFGLLLLLVIGKVIALRQNRPR